MRQLAEPQKDLTMNIYLHLPAESTFQFSVPDIRSIERASI